MQAPVTLDREKRRVLLSQTHTFVLVEVERIEKGDDGRVAISYNTSSYRQFGLDQWKNLVEAKGELKGLG